MHHNTNTLKVSNVQCFVCVCMRVHGHATILLCTHFNECEPRSTSVSMQLEYSVMDMWGTHATYCACERRGQAMLECQSLCSYARAMGFRLLDQQWGSGKASYTRMCTWKPKDQSCSPWQHVLYGNMIVHVRYSCYILCITTTHVVVWYWKWKYSTYTSM